MRRATNALNIDENDTTIADEFAAVDEDADVFGDTSDESVVKGDTACEQLEYESEDPEPLKPEATVS